MKSLLRLFGWCLLISLLITVVFTLALAWPEAHQNGVAEGALPTRIVGWLEYWLFWGILYSGSFYAVLALLLTVLLFVVALLWQWVASLWVHK